MGVLKAVLIVAVWVLAPFLIGWAMLRSRKPLWIRWAAGATAYVAYAGLARPWLHTMWSWLVVGVFADMFTVFSAILLGVPSEEAARLAVRLTRLDIIARAWVAFVLVPALVLAVAHCISA